MSNIVQISDFESGEFRIPKSIFQEPTIQEYIDRYERFYLLRLFGLELYDLFIADLNAGVPVSQRFTDVFNAFAIQSDCRFCDSNGMKSMIKGLIYLHYVRDTTTRNTTNGVKQTASENSVSIDMMFANLVTRYNASIDSFYCIQYKMCEDSATYPEYDGVSVEKVIPL